MNTRHLNLDVPHTKSGRYERNLIDTSVCELRFPTLLELETSIPDSFQKSLRKDYPIFEKQTGIDVGTTDSFSKEHRYLFSSKHRDWTITLKSSSIALETSSYTDSEEFLRRLDVLLEKSKALIDSDFFTRVGLRYINSVPIEDGTLEGWINPDIANALLEGKFGFVNRYFTVIQGQTDYGNYSLRHGMNPAEEPHRNPITKYVLDFDYFTANTGYKDTLDLVKKFSEINFSFFIWCIGPKAINLMGQKSEKKRV